LLIYKNPELVRLLLHISLRSKSGGTMGLQVA
jgi:hypothetical protein